MRQGRRLFRVLSVILTPLVIVATLLLGYTPVPLGASSHREAPLIASDPDADNTDVYAFISPDRNDAVTLVANYIPFEQPQGGPNFNKFADEVLYEIHIDNVGDAKSHITYQFRFTTTTRNPNTFLYNTGAINSLTDPNWNVPQSYSLTQVIQVGNLPPVSTVLASNLLTPPVNVGPKSTPNYPALAAMAISHIGTGPAAINVFAGPRDDPFFVDLGSIFDLLSLRSQGPPIGYTSPTVPLDGLSGYNVHSIVMQVPISLLATAGESVLGVWATASRPSTKVLSAGSVAYSGPFVQVSRLGMPLVNEVVIPRALKDAFNGLLPQQDYGLYTSNTPSGNLLKQSVLNPELQQLLAALYGVPNPGPNRLDLQTIFLTGIKTAQPFTINTSTGPVTVPAGTNVNQPAVVQPAEMLRINTALPFRPGAAGSLCAPTPDYQLGLLGGDVCGFPNGRRLADDVTDIELLAVGGAAYSLLTNNTSFQFNPALVNVLRDGVNQNDVPFLPAFPYLGTAHSGEDYIHTYAINIFAPIFATSATPRHQGGVFNGDQ